MRYALILIVPSILALGCTKEEAMEKHNEVHAAVEAAVVAVEEAKPAVLKELSVEEVDAMIVNKDAKLAVFDANGDETRAENGVIPTATLLPSSSEYELALLPSDKDTKLVFYCGSESCSASDTAAERAQANGYSDVCVLRAGIKGWKDAGKATVAFNQVETADSEG